MLSLRRSACKRVRIGRSLANPSNRDAVISIHRQGKPNKTDDAQVRNFKRYLLTIGFITAVLGGQIPLAAAQQGLWAQCSVDPLAALVTVPGASELSEDDIRFSAEEGEVSPSLATASGAVLVEQGDQRLQAPLVNLDRERGILQAEEVDYGAPEIALQSQRATVDLNRQSGVFDTARYYLPLLNAQGDAEQIQIQRAERRSQLQHVSYSTCARDQEFWRLQARQLELDELEGRGKARDITLHIKDVPLLYLPYVSFPINDQRQSGWLTPQLGYSSGNGPDITLPYYWNIAPNRDATFYPRLLGARGVLLGLQYRFLNPRDQGEIALEYMPEDRKLDRDRGAFRIRHEARPINRLYTDLLYQYVSDDDYLDDLENRLDLLNPTYLERHLDVVYSGENWQALARVQGFQTLDNELFTPEDEPYDRLPQFRFDGAWSRSLPVDTVPGRLNYELHTEAVRFDHKRKTTGSRFDFTAALGLPLEWTAGFITPRLSYRYTAYDLDASDNSGGADDRPTRSAPIFSLDSGLFFERPVSWNWSGESLQTLEPRLFYLYVPERYQTNIPLFDTTEIDRGFSWLFLENRFTGADRLADANQLTTALTSRVIGASDGTERLRASIGQIFYFDSPRVGVNDPFLDDSTLPADADRSPLIAEAQLNLDHRWLLGGAVQWDSEQQRTDRSALDLSYRPDSNRLLNVSYRFADNELEQLDLAAIWPLGSRWRAVGRWNYSLQTERNLDVLAGLQYEDCCWALRMVARHHRDDPDDAEADNAFYLELELKGLTGIGTDIDGLLSNAIFGYQPQYSTDR